MMLKEHQDAFGRAMYDYYSTGMKRSHIIEVLEREDGYVWTSSGPSAYFWEYRRWPLEGKKGLKYARGRILDIGCGAGRH